ncbi:MAG TPA: electron transfer flavoprotein subunit alpha/FixB family protein [Actinomycetota bacterium]|nr:electron transfer flavoprotein subunit alpha/FixB family protein [Actinomycetota bacterium]
MTGPAMILAYVEHLDGAPDDASLEAVSLARRLAEPAGWEVHALVVGGGGSAAASALGAHGASVLDVAGGGGLDGPYAPEAWGWALAEAVRATSPRLVLAPGTDRGQEVLAHAAAALDLPMAANCVEVTPGQPTRVLRQRWGGTLLEEAEVDAPTVLCTVALHAVPAEPAGAPANPEVRAFSPAIPEDAFRARVVDRVEPDRSGVSLAEAKVVVGGGRGVGGPEGFRVLEELAELLGGAVGCSRVVTSAGWRPHTDQIGQTGTRIAPDLYIACGISGATQHMVGARGAKRLLVINTDPEAPIVSHADWVVLGDLHEVLPAVVAAVREAKGA